MLNVGEKAPDFTLSDQNQKEFTLSKCLGKKVVLFFYSKDNTSGCTKQAIAFSDLANEFEDKNAIVVGVSKDSAASHEKFAQKHGLKLILVSDPELDAIKKYDVWQEKKLYGKISMGVVRSSYVIDENGIIIDAQTKVKPETNAEQVLCKL